MELEALTLNWKKGDFSLTIVNVLSDHRISNQFPKMR